MSNKDRIVELTTQIKDLEDRAAGLHADAFTLRAEREVLMSEMVLDENMLADTTWEIKLDGGTSVYLEWTGGDMDALTELIKTDWHSWFELADGIKLQFDDPDITLTFKEGKQLLPFARKNKLKLNGTGISDRLAKLKRDAAALEDICHQYNL
jgi:hypothetical protein